MGSMYVFPNCLVEILYLTFMKVCLPFIFYFLIFYVFFTSFSYIDYKIKGSIYCSNRIQKYFKKFCVL